jgi:hypothetical protein
MDHLRVDADQAYHTSRAVGNDAQELREELAGLQMLSTPRPIPQKFGDNNTRQLSLF